VRQAARENHSLSRISCSFDDRRELRSVDVRSASARQLRSLFQPERQTTIIQHAIYKKGIRKRRQTPISTLRPGIQSLLYYLCMLRSTFMLFLAVATGTLALQAKAQACRANAQSAIATDRPQITNSSVVVLVAACSLRMGLRRPAMGANAALISQRQPCDLESLAKPSSVCGPGLLLQ